MPRARKPKVLFVSHNHPEVRPGGAEQYALELYKGTRDAGEFEPVFIARSGPPVSVTSRFHEGRPITLVNDDPNQYFFYTEIAHWDWFYGRSAEKSALTRFFSDFLLEQEPDVVHFQHAIYFGYDILRVTRNTLPNVPIVYTLHEFLPICFHEGKMIRTRNNELCLEASPRRCHECFPMAPQQMFFMRERFIKSHFSVVDRFIAPSRFLMDRYVDWGLPATKITLEDYGRAPIERTPSRGSGAQRNRFAFFGQLSPHKGIDVLLEAMVLLKQEGFEGQLFIHGANLDWAPPDFQAVIGELLEKAGTSVVLAGNYESHELPELMREIDWVVVPSIWWENSPLVIQEAFLFGRPVICSDIGAMVEKVRDGVDGLYFRRGDPDSLAETMRRAAETPGLWERLTRRIPEVHAMGDHVDTLSAIYRQLIEERRKPRKSRASSEGVHVA